MLLSPTGTVITSSILPWRCGLSQRQRHRVHRPPLFLWEAAQRRWPSYQLCVKGAPPIHQGDRPDISKADFTFCMTAIDWGWSVEDTAQRLMQESTKAQENGERYALTTARNAAAAVERRGQPVKSTPHP